MSKDKNEEYSTPASSQAVIKSNRLTEETSEAVASPSPLAQNLTPIEKEIEEAAVLPTVLNQLVAAYYRLQLWSALSIQEQEQRKTESDFAYINFEGANLKAFELRGADLRGADLRDCSLPTALLGINLQDANLRKCFLFGAYIENGNLQNANLEKAKLAQAYLGGANLQGAKLRRAWLARASLNNADLSGADLRGADLSKASLRGANLFKAILRGRDVRDWVRLPDDMSWRFAKWLTTVDLHRSPNRILSVLKEFYLQTYHCLDTREFFLALVAREKAMVEECLQPATSAESAQENRDALGSFIATESKKEAKEYSMLTKSLLYLGMGRGVSNDRFLGDLCQSLPGLIKPVEILAEAKSSTPYPQAGFFATASGSMVSSSSVVSSNSDAELLDPAPEVVQENHMESNTNSSLGDQQTCDNVPPL